MGVDLGTGTFGKGHLIYDFVTNQVITSHHVRFHENVFPFAGRVKSSSSLYTPLGGGGGGGSHTFPSILAQLLVSLNVVVRFCVEFANIEYEGIFLQYSF